MLALLCGPSGATIATVTRSTGWQPHTVRAFLAAVVRKKLGLRLESEKTDGERVYRIVAGKASGGRPSPYGYCNSTVHRFSAAVATSRRYRLRRRAAARQWRSYLRGCVSSVASAA